jgi:hypothetical protein
MEIMWPLLFVSELIPLLDIGRSISRISKGLMLYNVAIQNKQGVIWMDFFENELLEHSNQPFLLGVPLHEQLMLGWVRLMIFGESFDMAGFS